MAAPAAHALPACAEAPCASDHGPVVILSYYRGRNLPRLVRAVRLARLPDTTPVYYGNYWGAGKPSEPKQPGPKRPRPRMPGGRFAPIFPLGPSVFWHGRKLPPALRRVLAAHRQAKFAGRIPPLRRLLRRSGAFRYRAGLELGRRFRDRIRSKRARHQRIVTWQFDEIPSDVAGPQGGRYRTFLRGILIGVAYGRPVLGDRKLPGIVFMTGRAIQVANHSAGGELASFWRVLDSSTLFLVGEEYSPFIGSPGAAARRGLGWQRTLRRWGGARRSLARKYVSGMTPGYRLSAGLGGNVRHRGRHVVNRWRLGYIRARAKSGVTGFSQYNFRFGNGSAAVMNDVMRAVARGVRVARAR